MNPKSKKVSTKWNKREKQKNLLQYMKSKLKIGRHIIRNTKKGNFFLSSIQKYKMDWVNREGENWTNIKAATKLFGEIINKYCMSLMASTLIADSKMKLLKMKMRKEPLESFAADTSLQLYVFELRSWIGVL